MINTYMINTYIINTSAFKIADIISSADISHSGFSVQVYIFNPHPRVMYCSDESYGD